MQRSSNTAFVYYLCGSRVRQYVSALDRAGINRRQLTGRQSCTAACGASRTHRLALQLLIFYRRRQLHIVDHFTRVRLCQLRSIKHLSSGYQQYQVPTANARESVKHRHIRASLALLRSAARGPDASGSGGGSTVPLRGGAADGTSAACAVLTIWPMLGALSPLQAPRMVLREVLY